MKLDSFFLNRLSAALIGAALVCPLAKAGNPLPGLVTPNDSTGGDKANAVEIKNPLPAGEGRVRAKASDVSTNRPQAQGAQALTPTGSAPLAPLSPQGEGHNSTPSGDKARLAPAIPDRTTASPATPAIAASDRDTIRKKWGVELLGLHPTAAGHLLDFRFKVSDTRKATPLLDRKTKPYLLSDKFKGKLQVPDFDRVGSLRQTTRDVEKGKVYTMLFANPGKQLAPGDEVTLVIGDFRVGKLAIVDPMAAARSPASRPGER